MNGSLSSLTKIQQPYLLWNGQKMDEMDDDDNVIPSLEFGHFNTIEEERKCLVDIITMKSKSIHQQQQQEDEDDEDADGTRRIAVVGRTASIASDTASYLEKHLLTSTHNTTNHTNNTITNTNTSNNDRIDSSSSTTTTPLLEYTISRFGSVRNKTIMTEYTSVASMLYMLECCLNTNFNGRSQRLYLWIDWVEKHGSGYGFTDATLSPSSSSSSSLLSSLCLKERYQGIDLVSVMKQEANNQIQCDEVTRDITEIRRMCQKKTLNTHAIRDSIYKLFTRRSKSSSSSLYERDGQKEDDEGIARLFSILDRYETTMKERYGTIRKISNEQILQDIIYECKLTNSLSSTGYGTSRSMNKRNEMYDYDVLEDKPVKK